MLSILLGIPTTILFCCFVIAVYLGIHYWRNDIILIIYERDQKLYGNHTITSQVEVNGTMTNVTTTELDYSGRGIWGTIVDLLLRGMPSSIQAIVIIIAGIIYKKVAITLVDKENHRDEHSYEYSLTQKTY